MIRYGLLPNPAEVLPDIVPLISANWQETGFGFQFAPSFALYQKAVDTGLMYIVAAWDDEKVIGYCTMIVSPMLHNPDITCAANDALFVDPSRRGYVGGRLMLEAEREAARRGATRIIWRTRAGTGLASALQKRGYLLADIGLTKEITDGNH